MRFAIAAAFFYQTLPATSESSGKVSKPNFSGTLEKKILTTVRESHGDTRGGKFLGLLKEKRVQSTGLHLKNLEKEKLRECEPESADADIGVLSCGVGRFCKESEESKKGGFCVASPDELDRALQGEPVTLFVGLNSLFCDPAGSYSADCNCTGSDEDAYTLEVDCLSPQECAEYTSNCGYNTTSCISYGFSFSLTGPGTYVVDRCFEDVLPYSQKTCYQTVAYGAGEIEACTISVDDEDCLSCSISTTEDGDYCYRFDCTNTVTRRAGDLCQPGVYVPSVLYYLRTYGCDSYICPICGGEDFVSTNPGGAIDIGEGQTTCAAVAQVALLGGFNETFCTDVVIPGVAAPCGCVPFGSAPVEVPTVAPATLTDSPVGSEAGTDTGSPTIAPVLVTFPPISNAPSTAVASTSTRSAYTNGATVASLVGLSLMAFLQFA